MNESSERMIESLLEEMLGGKRPPDLRHSILQNLNSMTSTDRSEMQSQADRWDEAIRLAVQKADDDTPRNTDPSSTIPSTASTISVRSKTHTASRSKSDRRVGPWIWGSLGLVAASGLFVVSQWLMKPEAPSTIVKNNSSTPNGSEKSKGAIPSATAQNSNDEKSRTKNLATQGTRTLPAADKSPQQLSLENVPFGSESIPELGSVPETNSKTLSKMDEAKIVEVIDHQFESLWSQSGVLQASELSAKDWVLRASRVLIGRDPKPEEWERWLPLLEKDKGKSAFLSQLAQTEEFAAFWAWRLSDAWLGTRARGDRSPARLAFESWLAKQLQEGKPLGKIQRELILAKGSDHPASEDFHPQSHWIANSFEGNPTNLAERLSIGMLDQNIVCSRCHDGTRVLGVASSQAAYWGSSILLSQISVVSQKQGDISIRRLVPKPPSERFYERPDGTMAVAVAALPNGILLEKLEGSLLPLANWLENADVRRNAAINAIWQSMLGQKLVPTYGLSEKDGARERQELQSFLAKQMQAHDEDLRAVVAWIGNSLPFSINPSNMGIDDYLLASDDELERWRIADRQLAFYTPPYPASRDIGGNVRLSELSQWIRKEPNGTVLAQPNALTKQGPKSSLNATESAIKGKESVRLVAHLRGIEQPLQAQLDAWLSSKMTWEQMVEHACWLSRGQGSTSKFRELAADILAKSNGDRKTAISRILLTEVGYY